MYILQPCAAVRRAAHVGNLPSSKRHMYAKIPEQVTKGLSSLCTLHMPHFNIRFAGIWARLASVYVHCQNVRTIISFVYLAFPVLHCTLDLDISNAKLSERVLQTIVQEKLFTNFDFSKDITYSVCCVL